MSLDIKILNILTWNIKRAGENKSKDGEAMDIFFNILTNGGHLRDIMLLQEVVNREFMEELGTRFKNNYLPYRWDIIDAQNNGEYYVVIYNKDTVGSPRKVQYVSPKDIEQEFQRPPVIIYFKKIEFGAMTVHTKPRERNEANGKITRNWALEQVQSLENAFEFGSMHFKSPRLLAGGDFNWQPPYWYKNKKNPFGMKKAVDFPGPLADTTTSKNTFEPYDHFIIDDNGTARIIDGQVLNFKRGFTERLKGVFFPVEHQKKMLYVSDHWPVEITIALGKPNMTPAEYGLFYSITQAQRIASNTRVYRVK